MSVAVLEARPPYVVFEVREVEDRAATHEKGHYVGKDVNFAIICPQGSRDRVERIAEEWLVQIKAEARNGRFPAEWCVAYEKAYAAWKEGRELPENGTPIRSWPVLSPSQVSHLLNLRVRTVEDLANLNEEGILRIGMGARSLQQKARDYLQAAQDKGVITQQMEILRMENEHLLQQNAELQAQQAHLNARLQEIEKLLPPDPSTIVRKL